MSLVQLTSIAICLVAFVYSLFLLRRVRDWRLGFLTIMLALMAIRQSLTLYNHFDGFYISYSANLTELSGLVLSVVAFLAVQACMRVVGDLRLGHEALTLVPRFGVPLAKPQRATEDASAKRAPFPPRPSGPHRVDIVAIGISTGGPNALADLLPAFRDDFPLPLLIVQHMPPVFTKNLANRLDKNSNLTVREGFDGATLAPGTAWIAPGGLHMKAQRTGTDVVLAMNENPPENSCRPAVDVLFRSVVTVYGLNTLAVIMTGMGHDGCLGCERVRESGGIVLAQDEASSVVWGMPGIVASSGLADEVLSLEDLPSAIMRHVIKGRGELLSVSAEESSS